MRDSLLNRVDDCLSKTGLGRADLEEFLRGYGISYPLTYLDAFAQPEHIYMISEFLRVRSSHLFEVTQHKDHLLRAIFDEKWPDFERRINASKSEAYGRIVRDREFKGEISGKGIRQEIDLLLQGLIAPTQSMVGCNYPDCNSCILRCRITGHMLGPED
jgi:hypothetical protein